MQFELIKLPDQRLRKVSRKVTNFREATTILKGMREIMHANFGMGLAAIQVGIDLRIICVGGANMINPVINDMYGQEIWGQEECLSCPGAKVLMKRYEYVLVDFVNDNDQFCSVLFSDLDAACVQHEIDHLDGKLIGDR